MTGKVDDLATCMLEPIRIVVFCDPDATEEHQWGMEKWPSFALRRHGSNGSHVALSQHVLSLLFNDFNETKHLRMYKTGFYQFFSIVIDISASDSLYDFGAI